MAFSDPLHDVNFREERIYTKSFYWRTKYRKRGGKGKITCIGENMQSVPISWDSLVRLERGSGQCIRIWRSATGQKSKGPTIRWYQIVEDYSHEAILFLFLFLTAHRLEMPWNLLISGHERLTIRDAGRNRDIHRLSTETGGITCNGQFVTHLHPGEPCGL